MTQGAPPILPFRPQIFPDAICDFANRVKPQRPRQGYRNMGRRPIDTVNLFLKPVSGEA